MESNMFIKCSHENKLYCSTCSRKTMTKAHFIQSALLDRAYKVIEQIHNKLPEHYKRLVVLAEENYNMVKLIEDKSQEYESIGLE